MYKVVNTIDDYVYGIYENYFDAQEVWEELNEFDDSWDIQKD